jgi:alkylation response protein AidB-like acyl-CoA dehydrogenase
MDLRFTAEEQQFRQEVRSFVRSHLAPDLREKVVNGRRLHKDDFQRWACILGAKGWLTPAWPASFGGPGWSVVQRYLFEEECAAAGAPRIMPFGPVMVAPVIMAFGSRAQQERFLPPIARGEAWWCQGYSEPGAGSDLASLRTRAERRGDCYVVNGQKSWTTLGQHADWIFCLVRTSSEGKPQSGISFLLVDMRSPGIRVRPIVTLDGEHEVNEVFFDDVEVPLENRVGDENAGWAYAKYLLAYERANIADVSRSKRELERLKRIAAQTLSGGRPLIEDVRFRDEIAQLEIDIIALEILVLRMLAAEREGKKALDIAGMLKIRGSEIQQRYAELMLLAAGPYAMPFVFEAMEQGWQGDRIGGDAYAPLGSAYFNLRKTTIYGGSNEIQRNVIAQQILG